MRYLVLLGLLASAHAYSYEVDSQGEIRMESRMFKSDDNNFTNDHGYGLFTRLEAGIKFKESNIRFKTSLVSRTARKDSERDVFYFEDAYVEKDFGSLQVFGGLRLVNWSTAEAFHPSDIINSRNFDTQFENAEKIGEPMVGLASQFGDWGVQAFYMPSLRGPKLPSSQNRLSFLPSGLSVGDTVFVDQNGETKEDWASQWAVKTSLTKWGGDWSLYWVHHFDRSQPQIALVPLSLEARPVFFEMDQIGLNLQQQVSDFMIKFELAQRFFDEDVVSQEFGLPSNKSHSLIAVGAEYTYGWNSGSETIFLAEAQFVEGVGRADRRGANIFQRDGLLGFRHALNNASSTEIAFIAIADLEISKQLMLNLSYSKRVLTNWKVKLGARYIDAPTDQVVNFDIRTFNQDHQAYLEISRFF